MQSKSPYKGPLKLTVGVKGFELMSRVPFSIKLPMNHKVWAIMHKVLPVNIIQDDQAEHASHPSNVNCRGVH